MQGKLTKTSDGSPFRRIRFVFTLGSAASAPTCSAKTDTTGTAVCSLAPNQAAGTYTLTETFAGDSAFGPSSASSPFVVAMEETVTKFTVDSPTQLANGQSAKFMATLQEDGVTPISGRTLTFALGADGYSRLMLACSQDRVHPLAHSLLHYTNS